MTILLRNISIFMMKQNTLTLHNAYTIDSGCFKKQFCLRGTIVPISNSLCNKIGPSNDNAVNVIHLVEAFQMLNQDNCNAAATLVSSSTNPTKYPPLSARKRLLRQIKPFHLQAGPLVWAFLKKH